MKLEEIEDKRFWEETTSVPPFGKKDKKKKKKKKRKKKKNQKQKKKKKKKKNPHRKKTTKKKKTKEAKSSSSIKRAGRNLRGAVLRESGKKKGSAGKGWDRLTRTRHSEELMGTCLERTGGSFTCIGKRGLCHGVIFQEYNQGGLIKVQRN